MLKQLSRQIKKIAAKEKKGTRGAWRMEFCREYGKLLQRIQNHTHSALVETLDREGGQVSCRAGCTHCCCHYVAVSLAHGVVIVDYLYKRKELLKRFTDNYAKWRPKGYAVSNRIDRMRLQALSSPAPMDSIIADTRPLSAQYRDMQIPCPFLADSRCLIYPVRPWSCSGHYAVSPPEWCDNAAPQEPVIHRMIPDDGDLADIIRITDPRLLLYELTLPTMVYRLMVEGSASVMAEMET